MLLRAHPVMGWHPLQGQSMARDPLLQYAFWKRTCKSLLNYDVSVQTWFSTRILLCFLSLNRFNLSSLKQKQNLLLILIRSGKSCGHISPQVREYGFQNPEMLLVKTGMWRSFACGIWNSGLWNPESSSRNLTNDSTSESNFNWQRIRNSRLGIQNPRLSLILLYGRYILRPCRRSHANSG